MSNYLYVGLSSGPVFELMQLARATKELWLSSYMFSQYSKHIVRELYEVFDDKRWAFTLISPNVTKEESERDNPMSGKDTVKDLRIGLYSDRIFFRIASNQDDLAVRDAVNAVIASSKKMLAEMMAPIVNDTVEACLDTVNAVVYTCSIYRKADVLPLDDMNRALDELELFAGNRPDETDGKTDRWVKLFNKDRLTKDYCKWINATNLRGADISKVAGQDRSGYKQAQVSKYYAIVVADGDGVGSVLGNTKNDADIQKISKGLLKYAYEAAKAVMDYSQDAYPVYFGGDDMLFFVPLFSEQAGKTLWTLLKELDALFRTYIVKGNGSQEWPPCPGCENCSVSAGVHIVYHKYPLNRAINETHSLLYAAKQSAYVTGQKKNAVHVQLRKHSGQTSSFLVSKAALSNPCVWNSITAYFELHEQESIVHNIHHRLIQQQNILLQLLQLQENRAERLAFWLGVMQEECPISADYTNRLVNVLTCLWDQRQHVEPENTTEKAEREANTKEKQVFLRSLDGVFRIGELMYTYYRPAHREGEDQ